MKRSSEFIQAHAQYKYEEDATEEDKKVELRRCGLYLPKDHQDKSHLLVLSECLMNMMGEINGYNKFNDEKKLHQIIPTISNFLGYLVNTTSWVDGEIHEFDVDELEKRIDRIKMYIKL